MQLNTATEDHHPVEADGDPVPHPCRASRDELKQETCLARNRMHLIEVIKRSQSL